MLVIEKINETYITVKVDDRGIEQELSSYFTFKVPNYQFMPRYKLGIWDGTISLYNKSNKTIYYGLLPQVLKFAKDRNYEILLKSEFNDQEYSLHEAQLFFDKINIKKFERYDHQLIPYVKSVRKGRSLILSPTGSGKSFIIWMLTKYYNKRTLIIVPTLALIHQMAGDFVDYGCDPEDIHKIYSGQEKYTDHQIIIGTWQSVAKLPQKWLDAFDIVIGDEVHLFAAKTLSGIMEKLNKCQYRFGLTGSLDKSETNKLVLVGLFGQVIKETTTKELMDKGILASMLIKCLVLRYPDEIRKASARSKYEDEKVYIIGKDSRNNFLKNLALSLKGNTIILYERIEQHGDLLNAKLAPEVGNRKYFYIHGGVSGEERDAIRPIVEEESDAIILASYGTFSTGINIKNISNIIFASPYKSQVKILQSIGRGLRKLGDKRLTLFDIVDDMRWKSYKNHMLRHFEERIKIYDAEQFDYRLYMVGIS